MNFNFDWNYVSSGAPYITVSELGLGFNISAVNMLDNPEYVMVGFDVDNLTIGVKAADEIQSGKKYKFYSRMNNGWVRIGCKDFINNLSAISGLSFKPAKKYVAKLNRDDNVLYITINNDCNIDEN